MKTILFPIDFGSMEGGAQLSTIKIINYFKNKFRIIVLIPRKGDFHINNCDNIKIIKILEQDYFFNNNISIKNIINIFKWFFAIRNIVFKENVDVIHFNFPGSFIFFSIMKLLFPIKVKTVWTDRGDFSFYKKYTMFVLRTALKSTDVLITTTKLNYKKWHRYKKRVYVIPDTIETTYHTVKIRKPDPKNIKIAQIGRIVRLKNYEFSIKLIKFIMEWNNNINLNLHIIGSTGCDPDDLKYLDELNKLVKELNLKEHIIFEGHINHKDLIRKLHYYDLLLSTSKIESFGDTIIEAFSQFVPVVASNTMGAKSIIKNNYNGILLKEFKYDDYSKSILKIISDYKFRSKIIINAYESVKNEYNLDKLNKYIKVYEGV